jgi:hypothetical protein
MISKNKLKRYLEKQFNNKSERKTSLEAWLIRYLCKLVGYDIRSHLKDIATHGCVSGCVNELIYNPDIIRFYQKYEPQIWAMVSEYIQSTGQSFGQFLDSFKGVMEDETDFKIALSWFSVEVLAYRFLEQLSFLGGV